MFIKDDIYTTSSSLKLYNCWTDKVTKFDSSAFYNWEQDNMPVYDLEERTYLLWEKLGFPTSSIPGVALAVSADASDNAIGCNKNIFRTVSAAIAALPEVINYPVIIEVANFGNLGDLVLNNFKFGPRGSLEIINRNFARADADASASFNLNSTFYNTPIVLNIGNRDETSPNSNNYLSSIRTNDSIITELDWEEIFAPKTQFVESSCLSISASVFSGVDTDLTLPTTDTRLQGNLNGFVSLAKSSDSKLSTNENTIYSTYYTKSNLITQSNNSINPYQSPNNHDNLVFKTYDLNPDTSDYIHTYDLSTIDTLNSDTLLNETRSDSSALAFNGLFYGNKLNKLVINNCEGPIFIKNFFFDGSSYTNTNNNYGIEVNNSKNIYLENNVVCRYRKAGIVFNNSNVTLLRGCVSTRNYNFNSSNRRITGPWSSKRLYDYFDNTTKLSNIDDGAGLIANNSYVTVSSTRSFEETIQRTHVLAKTALVSTSAVNYYPLCNKNYIFEFSKNANGIILNNSTFTGGEICYSDVINTKHQLNTINVELYGNIQNGIKASNSKISFDGRLHFIENAFGIKLNSSVFEIDKATFINNQFKGIDSVNSNITYNKNLIPYVNAGSNNEGYPPLFFGYNGQHITLDNSKFLPVITSAMDLVYDKITLTQPIGVRDPNNQIKQIIPSVEVTNNSQITLISPLLIRDSSHSVDGGSFTTCRGSELAVLNNSKATLKGSQYYATRVGGPKERSFHKNLAGVYAGNNSTVEINGPTVIVNYGVDLLAEKNSNININPHRSDDEGGLDISSFSLENKLNHTAVELHATRSCVVVDQNSSFNARDLGSFKSFWDVTGGYYTDRGASGFTYESIDDITPYVSGGSLQFYPNPIPLGGDEEYSNEFPGADSLNVSTASNFQQTSNRGLLYYLIDIEATQSQNYSAVTNGGFCVRAFNNSIVNVNNVNFPTGWWNCSAPYYDNTVAAEAGGLCSKTFIWNIADNSKLNTSYLSVSGLYPKAAGYVGPKGVWTSGSNLVASGLPIGTPDTSNVSILDYFGAAAASANPFGKTTAQNYGPFRLYFSVDPVVNSLEYNTAPISNVINQIYSQGYQPSNSMTLNSSVSSLYISLAQKNSSNNLVTSGFYYGSSFHKTGNFENIYLDESSSDTFANAKHCSVGKSGNVKLVSIYYPYDIVSYGDLYNTRGVMSFNSFDLQRDN